MTKHRWHDEIVAWASEAKIETSRLKSPDVWYQDESPNWNAPHYQHRIGLKSIGGTLDGSRGELNDFDKAQYKQLGII